MVLNLDIHFLNRYSVKYFCVYMESISTKNRIMKHFWVIYITKGELSKQKMIFMIKCMYNLFVINITSTTWITSVYVQLYA